MKKNFTLLATAAFLLTVFQTEAQNTLYPGLTSVDRTYMARKVSTPPTIDGNPADAAWAATSWRQAAVITPLDASSWVAPNTPTAPEGAFSGVADIDVQFKIVWDDAHYYIIFRYKDDKVIYSDVHNGYRTGSVPLYAAGVTNNFPALGAGDGSAYQAFRMDQFAYWFTPYTAGLGDGTTVYSRANNGLMHNFFPGQLTQSTKPGESVLWAPKHNAGTTGTTTPQNHVGTVAGTATNADGYFYIEFRDDTWSTLFSTVRTKLTDQKLYGPSVPAVVGDKFLLQTEVNDADGTTNRRDYVNYFTHFDSAISPLNNLKEALVVTLANADGTLGLKSNTLANSLKFYVDASSILRLNESLDVEIYNMVGQRVIKSVNSAEVNISSLPKGVYLVKDSEGKSGKLIRE
jgi:hypothetical protein